MTTAEFIELHCLAILFWVYVTPLTKTGGLLHRTGDFLISPLDRTDAGVPPRWYDHFICGPVVFIMLCIIGLLLIWSMMDMVMSYVGLDIKDVNDEHRNFITGR